MIVIVAGRKDDLAFNATNKVRYDYETDPNSPIYNEMCGHRWLLNNFEEHKNDPYLGLEHYRRAFALSDEKIKLILGESEIIVKEQHGPYGTDTNLTVLSGCSRHGVNYIQQATTWVNRWRELMPTANYNLHYGCNMFITTPQKYKAMMEDEFGYIDEMLKYPNLQPAVIGYFCETILTPYIITKHNKFIYTGKVVCA